MREENEKMDIKELEAWLQTEQGRAWLDEKKSGLVKKNEQLIGELKTACGGSSEISLRLADVEKALEIEKAANKRALLDAPLLALLESKGVFNILMPEIARQLTETYGLTIHADGEGRKVIGKIKDGDTEKELTLTDAVDTWLKTDDARQYIDTRKNTVTVVSTVPNLSGGDPPSKALDGKNGRELAEMSDNDFQNAVKTYGKG
jgi:hypothetical protein